MFDLYAEVEMYTNFVEMKKNLGQNCEGEDDLLLSFLKDMLHSNKRWRKEPGELLSHEFIKMGEDYLEEERLRFGVEERHQSQLRVRETI